MKYLIFWLPVYLIGVCWAFLLYIISFIGFLFTFKKETFEKVFNHVDTSFPILNWADDTLDYIHTGKE